jgi:hypothetical protein
VIGTFKNAMLLQLTREIFVDVGTNSLYACTSGRNVTGRIDKLPVLKSYWLVD